MNLGKIKRIKDLRSVWKHEAKDFSEWLSKEENLAELSDTIGVDIVLEERESAVGSFSVDLYAVEESTGRRIIIENQLEDTNHDHLGKLITYASGKGAEVIVWIVKRARDEHRQAIEWLNQNTGVNIGFFLVEIELWQIDDSLVAPKFNVVERPNDWAKQMKNVGDLSSAKQLQLKFWQQLSETIKSNELYTKEFSPRKALPAHWYSLAVGSSQYHIELTLNTQKNLLGVQIRIPDNKEKFFMFKKYAGEIEKILDTKIECHEANKVAAIKIQKPCDINDELNWNQAIDWLMSKAIKFKEVIKKFDQ